MTSMRWRKAAILLDPDARDVPAAIVRDEDILPGGSTDRWQGSAPPEETMIRAVNAPSLPMRNAATQPPSSDVTA